MFTPAQLRAARALLNWSQDELGTKAGVSPVTIRLIETEKTDPKRSTLIAIQIALAKAGIVFLDPDDQQGEGLRFRKPPRK